MSSSSSGQPDSSVWELSMYEVQRKPHEVVTDSSLLNISPRALHSELMCPICLDLMKNAQTTKECLHRFCQECIITALRSGNKECPTCRKKLASKRSLRSDPNFDALIAKIYPNREELFQQERQKPTFHQSLQYLSSRKRRANTPQDAPTSASTSETSSPSRKVPKVQQQESEDTYDVEPADSSSSSKDEEEDVRLEFQLRPHPSDKSVSSFDIRNLATSPGATVAHIAKFLSLVQEPNSTKPNNKITDSFIISTQFGPDEYIKLSETTSLKQICDNYWTAGEKMMLYFSSVSKQNQL